ncbi:N-6 DNA methylase [Luedemannella flava]
MLRWLMIARGKKKGRGGFISYAQLGINQLGAVYEGLMSYTGFIAAEELYEVAKYDKQLKRANPESGSWMIPSSKVEEYPAEVFVEREDPETGVRSRVRYPKGAFVYRLAGRDRQISASYYTPQSLTEVTVQLALKYRLEEEGREVAARELLDWTICEPALGSGAFLNEAINQVAAEYLRRAQKERGETLDPEKYAEELQRVKAYIALHNCYGVDLNRTAVELAEVSLWLNTMHPGLQAPWFGLHLQRGNSLIGCGRKTYEPAQVADRSWLKAAPAEHKLCDGDIPDGVIHHFLLPADGWGVVAGNKEAKTSRPRRLLA